MRMISLAFLAAIVATMSALLPAAATTNVPWPVVSLSASASPSQVPTGATVTYTDALTNAGDGAGTGARLTHTLPAGFTYIAGSTGIYRDGILIGRPNPTIAGRTLTWSGLTAPPRRGDTYFGINTMVQERCDIGYITWQLDHVRNLMGSGAWAKQLFYGVTTATTVPQSCWIDYVNAAYDRGLKPVIRLAGVHGGSFWHKPQPDWPGNYASIAQAFARVAAGLPRRDGHTLTIQIWNEPNLNLEWGNAASPIEYGQFLEQTAGAIRTATGGDPRLVIMNGPLAPGGDVAPATFMQQMFAGVPNSRWAFDVWAAHSYPGNYPPELNIHHGKAVRSDVTIDSYVPQVEILAANGRATVPVFLSETGYLLGQQLDRRYPLITEANRADYIRRALEDYWRAWPELMSVAPYELSDPSGAWSGWNWVESDGSQHTQYGSVQALDKSYPYVASQLTVKFQARAASTAGLYTNVVEVSADNFGVAPQTGVAPVIVNVPTATVTPTRLPSATATSTATPAPTPSPTPTTSAQPPTGTPSPTPTATGTDGAIPSPTLTATTTPTSSATLPPTETSTLSATLTPTQTSTPSATLPPTETSTPSATLTPTATASWTATRTQTPTPTHTITPVAMPLSTVWVGQEPHGLAVDSGSGRVFAALHRVPVVSVINGNTGTLAYSIGLGNANGGNGIAYDSVSDHVFIANKHTSNVSRSDAANGANLAEFSTGSQPDGVAVDPETEIVYVANFDSNTITMLDGATGALLHEEPGGGQPSFIALDPRHGRFYVTNHLGATIGVHDLGSGTLLKTLPTGGGPYGIALDPTADRLYTADRDGRSVTIVDVEGDTIVKRMPLDCAPYQVAVNPASGHLFVLCPDEQQMHIYNLDDTRWLAWVRVGRGAEEGIAVDVATGRVYVSNGGDDSVSIFQDSGPVMPPTLVPTPRATPTPTATPTPWLPGDQDAYEPDDAPSQAGTLIIGAPPAEHTFHRAGDVDWVSVVVESPGYYLFRAVSAQSVRAVLAIYAPDGETQLTEAAPDSGSTTTYLSWHAKAPGRYFVRVRELNGLGGIGASYLLSALALPNSLYLPLISKGDPVEPAKAGFGTGDGHEETGVGSLKPGVRSRSEPAAPNLIPDMTWAVSQAARNDPANLILAGEDETIYVASPERHAVLAVDSVTRAVRASAPGFQQPGGLAVLHDATLGDRLFAADTLAGTVRVLDAGDLRTLAETAVGPGPYALAAAPEAGHVFVALSGGDEVAMLDANGTLLSTTRLGGLGFPQGLAADPTDGRVYVSYALSPRYGQIAALDGATGTIVGIIPPTLDRPLAGAGRLTSTQNADDPTSHRLLVATDQGVLTYDLDVGLWEDVSAGDRTTSFPEGF